MTRYKFYREHKYVCAAINDVERLIAKTDFTSATQTAKVKEAFDALLSMLRGHADYENSRLHRLLGVLSPNRQIFRYLVVSGQKRDQANSSSGIVSKTVISSAEADPIVGVMFTLSLFAENFGTWSEGLFQKTWFKFPIGPIGRLPFCLRMLGLGEKIYCIFSINS